MADPSATSTPAPRPGLGPGSTRKGIMAYSPDGTTKVLMHRTPSDHRAYRTILAQLKKGGFQS